MGDPVSLEEPGLEGALANLQSVLIPAETLEAWAVQRRIFSLTHRRALLAATSGRLIALSRRLLSGFNMTGIRWQDLEEVSLSVGIAGATLTVRVGRAADLASDGASGAQRLVFPGLRKAQAQAVYRVCQAQDQAWREKRRIRELEELRARSGGIQVSSAALGGAAQGAGGESVRRLQEAKQLVEAKLITDSEYEAIKAKIVSAS
jgi:hypothetical protein